VGFRASGHVAADPFGGAPAGALNGGEGRARLANQPRLPADDPDLLAPEWDIASKSYLVTVV
jgi:hypothetical protein